MSHPDSDFPEIHSPPPPSFPTDPFASLPSCSWGGWGWGGRQDEEGELKRDGSVQWALVVPAEAFTHHHE